VTRFPLGRVSTLTYTVTDADGNSTTVAPAPTVTISDDAGDVVVSSTSTTLNSGAYVYTLSTSVRNALGVYDATYTYTQGGQSVSITKQFEVVGNHLFEIAELREFDEALVDDTTYTSTRLASAREDATERLENAADVAFTVRATRQVLSGDGSTKLLLPHSDIVDLFEAWIDGVELDLGDVEVKPEGILVYANGWTYGTNNVEVRYSHGYQVTPEPVKRAAKMLAVEYVVTSALPARATSQSTDVGDFRIAIANVDAGRDTGIPEVDAVISRFGRRRPRLG
jgi:hypothetical protein